MTGEKIESWLESRGGEITSISSITIPAESATILIDQGEAAAAMMSIIDSDINVLRAPRLTSSALSSLLSAASNSENYGVLRDLRAGAAFRLCEGFNPVAVAVPGPGIVLGGSVGSGGGGEAQTSPNIFTAAAKRRRSEYDPAGATTTPK